MQLTVAPTDIPRSREVQCKYTTEITSFLAKIMYFKHFSRLHGCLFDPMLLGSFALLRKGAGVCTSRTPPPAHPLVSRLGLSVQTIKSYSSTVKYNKNNSNNNYLNYFLDGNPFSSHGLQTKCFLHKNFSTSVY